MHEHHGVNVHTKTLTHYILFQMSRALFNCDIMLHQGNLIKDEYIWKQRPFNSSPEYGQQEITYL